VHICRKNRDRNWVGAEKTLSAALGADITGVRP
jgi:hypothetical protein